MIIVNSIGVVLAMLSMCVTFLAGMDLMDFTNKKETIHRFSTSVFTFTALLLFMLSATLMLLR